MNTYQISPLVELIDNNCIVLPSVINNKVCIIKNDVYQLIPFGRYTVIQMEDESINPQDYAVLKTDRYTCIVNCKPSWIETWRVKKAYREYIGENTMNSEYLFKGTII